MTLRELTWMDQARERAVWDVTKWILASLHKAWSGDTDKIPFDIKRWDIPEQLKKQEAERIAAEQRKRDEAKAMQDPAFVEAYRKKRAAEFQRFISQIQQR